MSVQSGKTSGKTDFDGLSPDDQELDSRIKSFRRAEMELEEIMSDPFLDQARKEVASMMVNYNEMMKTDSFRESEAFIRSSFSEEERTHIEANEIKNEADKNKINDLSAEWVREWHRKKQMQGFSPSEQERKSFIASSLASETTLEEPVVDFVPLQITGKNTNRRRITRFISMSAAAVLGAFVILRVLLPSSDTGNIYESNYKTFQAVAPTVRGNGSTVSTDYISALASYKKGNYNEAEAGFIKAVNQNPADLAAAFYLGLSQLETGNIDKAVENLTAVISGKGKFVKESQWYLGMAFLKKGDTERASAYFTSLASSDGYYRKASEKILRRLK